MKNIELLLSNVDAVNNYSIFGTNKVIIKEMILTGNGIYTIFKHIKWMEEKKLKIQTTIEIQSGAFKSSDVVNVLEIVMLYLSKFFPSYFKIQFSKQKIMAKNILYINSLLKSYDGKWLNRSYMESFHKTIYSMNHFRKILDRNSANGNYLCSISDDIKYLIKNNKVNKDLVFDSCESMTEMIENVLEHSDGDCLIDVKVAENTLGKIFLCLNVISLTNIYVGSMIMSLLENKKNSNMFSGQKLVEQAYKNHSSKFDEKYDLSAFCFVSSFQLSVSTRNDTKYTGGTGFTTLLKNINSKSFNKDYDSYILSGDNTIYFRSEFLNVDENGLAGFNESNDYLHTIPNEQIVKKEEIKFPGTIFCVNLITEKEI